ncbi:MAG: hypothetical protein M3Y65_20695 [Pseudomonadota bacterium]|nr:hypothetical protein [Pseudomonadota bacterium]
MTRQVTEEDLRAPEYREGKAEDYERRSDGKIVRKDRFVRGMQDLAAILVGTRDYEIVDVIAAARRLNGVRMLDALEKAEEIYEGEEKAIQALDYVKAVLNAKQEPTS